MKSLWFVFLLLVPILLFGQQTKTLSPCPKSPNCVSTEEGRRWKSMDAIKFDMQVDSMVSRLVKHMTTYSNATLVEHNGHYLHYEFKTKIGGFIDDVEFLINGTKNQIEFRSASRKGYSDMGKNKRRMKKIRRRLQLQ